MRWRRWLFLLFLCAGAGDALAVIGRPLTPVSYAGVARRTARRTTYVAAAAATTAAAPVTTLPVGCVRSGPYYSCGGIYYQPHYDGPNVVYVQVEKSS